MKTGEFERHSRDNEAQRAEKKISGAYSNRYCSYVHSWYLENEPLEPGCLWLSVCGKCCRKQLPDSRERTGNNSYSLRAYNSPSEIQFLILRKTSPGVTKKKTLRNTVDQITC